MRFPSSAVDHSVKKDTVRMQLFECSSSEMDITTLLYAIISVSIVLGVVVTLISRSHPSKGMMFGAFALAALAVGLVFLAARPLTGATVSILFGNTLIAVGLAFIAEAMVVYQGRIANRYMLWAPVCVLVAVLLWFIDDMPSRIIANAGISSVQVIFIAWISARGRARTPGWGWSIVVAACAAYGGSVLLRAIAVAQQPNLVEDLLTSSWLQSTTYLVSLNGVMLFAIGLIAMAMEQALQLKREAEEDLRSYVENANDVLYTLNLKGEFEYLSANIRKALGFEPEEVVGKHFSWIVHPDDLPNCKAFFERLVKTHRPEAGLEYRARHRQNGWSWQDTNAAPLFDAKGHLRGMLGIGRDINQRKLYQTKLEKLAHYDALTGLPNRSLIIDRCNLAIKQAHRDARQIAVMFLDLDGLKLINDRYGHEAGDIVLKTVASWLTETLRESDSVGRLGGDEYLLILPSVSGQNDALEAARRILQAMSKPLKIDQTELSIDCSIGIAMYPQDGEDADTLIRQADGAMYGVKRSGGHNMSLAGIAGASEA